MKIHNTNALRGNRKSLSYNRHSLANTNTMFKNTLDECSNKPKSKLFSNGHPFNMCQDNNNFPNELLPVFLFSFHLL